MNPFRSILSRFAGDAPQDTNGRGKRYLLCAECGDLFRPMPGESADWCRQCLEVLADEAREEGEEAC